MIESINEDSILERIEVDLEFLQLLSNPSYVAFLIKNDYFENRDFLEYLDYLSYIQNDKDLKCLVKYPISFNMLENIKSPDFIEYWKNNLMMFTDFLNEQLFCYFLSRSTQG